MTVSPAGCNSLRCVSNSPDKPDAPPEAPEGTQEAQPDALPASPEKERKPRRGGPRADRVNVYQRLLEAFREYPGQTKVVAALVGTARETAKRAWEKGWPATASKPALPPIKDSIADENLATRAVLYEKDAKDLASQRARKLLEDAAAQSRLMTEKAKNEAAATLAAAEKQAKDRMAEILRKAKLDSAQAIADRAQMLNLGRKSAIAAVALPALVLQDVQEIAKLISKAIKEGQFKSPNQAIAAGHMLTRMVESSERALHNFIQAENLDAGRPTDILAVQAEDYSLEDTEKELRVLQRAIERKKQREGLTNGQAGDGSVLPH